MSFLDFENVSYAYVVGENESISALANVSFSIERGECVALVGCNGSGKSTLARLCNGLIVPDRGEVRVDGVPTTDVSRLFDIRKKIGVVFQNPDNQTVTTIVEDDVAFGPENLGLERDELISRVEWALKSVGMYEHKNSATFRLSGGQKQRVAIAGVLAIKPELMILDEATGMLDPTGRREVLDVVRRLNRENGMAVLMITHFMEEAATADRIIVLDGGRLVADGDKKLFETPEAFTAAGLELPLFVRVAKRLNALGMDIGCPLATDELVRAVAARLAGRSGV